jgi:glucuronoarabinoxylan endo-1,4-beta-xylanase
VYRLGGLIALVTVSTVLATLLGSGKSSSPVTVEWNATRQRIDGFGASATGYTGTFTQRQADAFFDPATGLGLSILRIRAIPTTIRADCECVANSGPVSCVVGSDSQIVSGDLQVAQLAAARGVQIVASPWSPPAAMKSSKTYCSGGVMLGNEANYTSYAKHLSSFPTLLNSKGVSIVALSIQNEPDLQNSEYDTCMWTAEQIHDFIPYLSNALSAAGLGSLKIAIPEESTWTFDRLRPVLQDPETAKHVGLVMGHAYRVETPRGISLAGDLHVWQTEVSDFGNYDGSMTDAMTWAQYIHNYLSVGVNAWMYWSVDCGFGYFNHDNNMCLTDQHGHLAKRAYVLGQFAKFIRTGWYRVDVSNSGPLLVSAFKGPGKEFAMVAINRSIWSIRGQEFVLRGLTSERSGITPWITSSTKSLSVQRTVSTGAGGDTFTYNIPGESVVTFYGHAD